MIHPHKKAPILDGHEMLVSEQLERPEQLFYLSSDALFGSR